MVPKIASPLLFATHASGGKWKPQRHLAYIDRKITDAIAGRGSKRLIVTIPPRHGKSLFISQWFPAWHIGMYPAKRVILASYEAEFAGTWGRKARGVLEEHGHWFGVQVDPSSRASSRWGVSGYAGGMQTAGAGGPLTGSGADCLAAGTLVETEAGAIAIEDICRNEHRIKVVSYNHEKGRRELRRVEAFREIKGREVLRLETVSGRVVTCTPDHRVYVCGKGYIPAVEVSPGDTLRAFGGSLPEVRRAKGKEIRQLPQVLLGNQGKRIGCVALLELRKRRREKAVRLEESRKERISGYLLRIGLCASSPRNQESAEVHYLRRSGIQENAEVLREVQAEAKGPGGDSGSLRGALRYLPEDFPKARRQPRKKGLLLAGLCEQGALSPDGWQGQSQVEKWGEPSQAAAALSQSVSDDAAKDIGTGRASLRGLSTRGILARSPYRPMHDEQREQQFSNPVLFMPSEMARGLGQQGEFDVVALVERVREKATVYDIQVEGNRNFYANGVLVHNCLIIDDAIKNAEEAYSDTIRNKIWDWWLSTAYSRLEPGGIAIVLHTRWHEDDLIGRLIREMESGGEQWEVINFPAIAEGHDVLGRAPGEALWPERYGVADLERIKNTVGPYWWSSLYQQRPAPLEGGMFKREWFKVVEGHPKLTKKCRFWDLAATDSGGDWTVGALIGLDEEGDYIILDVVRGQWEPHKRDAVILQTAASDGKDTLIRAEQEPGAAGVAQIDALTRKLQGYRFKGERASGDKVVRADAAASQSGIGRVKILRGEWNRAFLDELAMFPNGKHDDQVDAFSGSFNALIKPVSSFMVA